MTHMVTECLRTRFQFKADPNGRIFRQFNSEINSSLKIFVKYEDQKTEITCEVIPME